MTSQDVATVLTATLVPLVTGIVGAIGILFQERRAQRSTAERHRLAYEDAAGRVGFALQWLEARKSVTPSPDSVQEATDTALSWITEAAFIVDSAGMQKPEKDKGPVVGRLFLFYRMYRWSARTLRVTYYLCLLYLLWLALIVLGETLSHASYADRASWEITSSVTFGLLALTLRAAAVSADRPKATLAANVPPA
jgi:hypothetical protein